MKGFDMRGRNENTMSDREYLDMIISERIGLLVGREEPEREDSVSDRGEEIIRELPEEKRTLMEAYISRLVEVSADHERYLYLNGVEDGIRLMLEVEQVRRGGDFERGRSKEI